MISPAFPAKLLLFGEYSVLYGGEALAMPLTQYRGFWESARPLSSKFSEWLNHIKSVSEQLTNRINCERLDHFLQNSRFVSTIPVGVGLGSSAALSASIYDLFSDMDAESDLKTIREDLGMIESFFHGKSSGFDPLISYLGKSIWLMSKDLREVEIDLDSCKSNIYLLDSGESRNTDKLVGWFDARREERGFNTEMKKLGELSNRAIRQIIKRKDILPYVKEISEHQYQFLANLITPQVRIVWKQVLNDPNIAIKLCGAGGGGYYLIFSKNKIEDKEWIGLEVEKINSPGFVY